MFDKNNGINNTSQGTVHSFGIQENFYRIDYVLNSFIRNGTLSMDNSIAGILLRTILLGETKRLFDSSCRKESFKINDITNGRSRLLLDYSRFYKVGYWLERNPGPCPILKNSFDSVKAQKFGILCDPELDLKILKEIDIYIQKRLPVEFPRIPLLSSIQEGTIGFQIDSLDPFQFRLGIYSNQENRSFSIRNILKDIIEREKLTEKIGIDFFERYENKSIYIPDINRKLSVKPIENIERYRNGNNLDFSLCAFKQKSLPCIKYKISQLTIRCQ